MTRDLSKLVKPNLLFVDTPQAETARVEAVRLFNEDRYNPLVSELGSAPREDDYCDM